MSQSPDIHNEYCKESLLLSKTDFSTPAETCKKDMLVLEEWDNDNKYTFTFDSHGTFFEEEFLDLPKSENLKK